MDRATFLAKAEGLQERLTYYVDRQYNDPKDVTPFFEVWLPLRETLREQESEVFGDLPPLTMPKSSGTTDNSGRGYFHGREVGILYQDITYCIRVLSKLPKPDAAAPAIAVTREGVFFAGQYFDALQRISDLTRSAKTEVLLIDGYVDSGVLDVLTARANGVAIRILTRKASYTPAFDVAAKAFNKQYTDLDVRLADDFHDRFLIIDKLDAYHLGASVKDAGRRGFMFSRIEEPSVVEPLRKRAEEVWTKAARPAESITPSADRRAPPQRIPRKRV